MTYRLVSSLATIMALVAPSWSKTELTPEDRIEIMRGLTAEYATAKIVLPRSKKPLPFESSGAWDRKKWDEAGKEFGPAARAGDLVQISKVEIDDDKITLEINGGMKGGKKWYDRIEVGMGGGSTRPVGQRTTNAPGGTTIVVEFGEKYPVTLTSADIKKMLAPVLDFETRSSTEQYVDTLSAFFVEHVPPSQPSAAAVSALTARETEVLSLLAGGHTAKEIATALGVSPSTAQRHVANIYAKIGARGRVDAAAYALARGLVRARGDG